eukprot:scaffold226502_cov35-Tisochrysis_lutea.AAC.1
MVFRFAHLDWHRVHRAPQVVGDVEQVLGKVANCKFARVLHVDRSSPARVVCFGERAKQLVVLGLELFIQLYEPLLKLGYPVWLWLLRCRRAGRFALCGTAWRSCLGLGGTERAG